MKKRRAAILLFIVILCVFGISGLHGIRWYKLKKISVPCLDTVLGIHILEETDILHDKTALPKAGNDIIAFENVLLPYDSSSNTLYLSQSLKGWTGSLSTEGWETYFLCAPQDEYWYKEEEAIKEGHVFTIWAVGEDIYYEFQMVISGMPIINITTERMEPPEPVEYEEDPDSFVYESENICYGTIQVFNPDVWGGTEQYEILDCKVRYQFKGMTSKTFPKKSYNIKLQSFQWDNIDVSLLGMRADHSWKLNSLYTDSNRIREISAAQIWESIDAVNDSVHEPGPRLEYAELIVDGRYQGIYGLAEPVDEKKLDLNSNDVLYRIINWEIPGDKQIQESIDRKWRIQYPIRLRYPKAILDYEQAWAPMRNHLNLFYREAHLDYDTAMSAIDLENITDYSIFLMACSASDNWYKNIFYAARKQEDGTYKMYLLPWDLDYTFGNIYAGAGPSDFNADYTVIYEEPIFGSLLEAFPEEIRTVMADKWEAYRNDILSTESILGLFESNRSYIMDTGAIMREAERWPESDIDTDLDEIIDYQIKRLEWLDKFFDGGMQRP